MRWIPRLRMLLARRPWLYWLLVALMGLGVATQVHASVAAAQRARDHWGSTVTVLIANIMPRLAPASVTIPANLTGGQTVLNLAPLAYSAYGAARLNYSISSAFTAEGALAFSVSALTGTVFVATFPSPVFAACSASDTCGKSSRRRCCGE